MISYKPTLNVLSPGTQISGIDLGKYIMAIAVVAIHVDFCAVTHFPQLIIWFINLAVPFFFVTSGFIMKREMTSKSRAEIKQYLKIRSRRILKLFSLWILIYLPISLIELFYFKPPLDKFLLTFFTNLLVNGEVAYAWPLWFLYSLLLTTVALWLTEKHTSLRKVYICIVVILYLWSKILKFQDHSQFPFWLTIILKYFPLRALSSGIYVFLGMLTYKYYQKLPTIPH